MSGNKLFRQVFINNVISGFFLRRFLRQFSEGIELNEDQLEAVSGGCDTENDICPRCNKPARIEKDGFGSIPCAYVANAEHTA